MITGYTSAAEQERHRLELLRGPRWASLSTPVILGIVGVGVVLLFLAFRR